MLNKSLNSISDPAIDAKRNAEAIQERTRQTHTHRGISFETFPTSPPDNAGENHLFTWSAKVKLQTGDQLACTDAIGRGEAIQKAESAIDEWIDEIPF